MRKGTAPHLILTIGAAGAGKSTVAPAIAASKGACGYVTLDYDLAVKYHPRFRDVWDIPDFVTMKPTGVGLAMGYLACNDALEEILIHLYHDLVGGDKKYNIILQSHNQLDIVTAKHAGYRTTLLFVGAPLAVAQRRSRTRAVETGKFLAPTLRAQEELVESMWVQYASLAPWYGLWADEFLVADNREDDGGKSAVAGIWSADLRRGSWDERLAEAGEAIRATYMPPPAENKTGGVV